MKENIKLFLDWSLPILCLINLVIYWGDTTLVTAWVVATTGWAANLINRYKNV